MRTFSVLMFTRRPDQSLPLPPRSLLQSLDSHSPGFSNDRAAHAFRAMQSSRVLITLPAMSARNARARQSGKQAEGSCRGAGAAQTFQQLSGSRPSVPGPVCSTSFPVTRTLLLNLMPSKAASLRRRRKTPGKLLD